MTKLPAAATLQTISDMVLAAQIPGLTSTDLFDPQHLFVLASWEQTFEVSAQLSVGVHYITANQLRLGVRVQWPALHVDLARAKACVALYGALTDLAQRITDLVGDNEVEVG